MKREDERLIQTHGLAALALSVVVVLSGPLHAQESVQDKSRLRSWLGFCIEPVTDAQKQALLDMNARAIRIGDHMNSWRSETDYPLAEREKEFVAWAVEHGIRPIYLLSYSPTWANAETRRKYKYPHNPSRPWEDAWCPPDDPQVWKKLVKATMERHKGKVFDYEVWNEPNSGFYFRGPLEGDARAELMQRYVELCRVTHEAAREVDPKIKVFTCGPHNDFFGRFMGSLFDLGIAPYSDGLALHIYVTPHSMAGFDVWWAQYMNIVSKLERRAGRRLPLAVTEYGYNHNDRPERGAAQSLAQNTALLASGRLDIATQFTFHHPHAAGDAGYAIFRGGSFSDTPTSRTLSHLFGLFNEATYMPLEGASISPPGESLHVAGTPRMPDNKFYAFQITRPDGKQHVYVAIWRGRFDYSKGVLIDIPEMPVMVRLPGRYRAARELDTKTGNLEPFTQFEPDEGAVRIDLTLDGVHDGVEGWPRAFIFDVAD